MDIGQVTSAAEWIIGGVQHRQFGHRWAAKEIKEGNEKSGEMNYNNTGAMWTGTREKETETFGSNMLRLSSCSGLIMAEEDDDDDDEIKR